MNAPPMPALGQKRTLKHPANYFNALADDIANVNTNFISKAWVRIGAPGECDTPPVGECEISQSNLYLLPHQKFFNQNSR
jgi:hypothetical protein